LGGGDGVRIRACAVPVTLKTHAEVRKIRLVFVPLKFSCAGIISVVFQMVCAGSLHQSLIKSTSILAPLLGFVVERLLGNNYVILRLANSLKFLPLCMFQVHVYLCLERL
jgi:hypothetical protein